MINWPPRKSDIPNILSITRLILIPFMVVLFLIPQPWAAWTCLVLYTIASISDYLDGYYARRYSQFSPVGVFLDPIADKLFVASVLLMFTATGRLTGLWAVPALLILMREIFIAGLREFLAGKEVKIPVTRLAKWKTGVQMGSMGFIIMYQHVTHKLYFSEMVEWIGKTGILVAMVLTLITGWNYARNAWPHLKN
ncbi:MAG: pgsA [Alphaproteobacteria bacterium]|nr:pgsA [Alphaproteobacteria bacterium]